jgi:hypothetical protein
VLFDEQGACALSLDLNQSVEMFLLVYKQDVCHYTYRPANIPTVKPRSPENGVSQRTVLG